MSDTSILKVLQDKRQYHLAEAKKLDEMVRLYKSPSNGTNGVIKSTKRNGNTTKVIDTARRIITEKSSATTQEIADRLISEGFQGNYAHGLKTQISAYLARAKEFKNTEEGWVLVK